MHVVCLVEDKEQKPIVEQLKGGGEGLVAFEMRIGDEVFAAQFESGSLNKSLENRDWTSNRETTFYGREAFIGEELIKWLQERYEE